MTTSITLPKKTKRKETLTKLASALLFLLVWQVAAAMIGNRLLLVGPVEVLVKFCSMMRRAQFWAVACASSLKIMLSFLLAFSAALVLSVTANRFPAAEVLLRPYMLVIKSVPVVSFIVLALLWLSSARLSIFIAFLMILPVLYQNSLQGLRSADKGLLQLARVSHMKPLHTVRLIYIPALKPYVLSASRSALGICWKAGIAAEVIGISPYSIGGMLYQAKVNLEIPELFVWTAVTVLLCVGFEKLFIALLKYCFTRLEVPGWTSK